MRVRQGCDNLAPAAPPVAAVGPACRRRRSWVGWTRGQARAAPRVRNGHRPRGAAALSATLSGVGGGGRSCRCSTCCGARSATRRRRPSRRASPPATLVGRAAPERVHEWVRRAVARASRAHRSRRARWTRPTTTRAPSLPAGGRREATTLALELALKEQPRPAATESVNVVPRPLLT